MRKAVTLLAIFVASLLIADLEAQPRAQTVQPVVVTPAFGGFAPVFQAGGSTDTFLPTGLHSVGRSVSDNATLNTWNVISQSVSANLLLSNGTTLHYVVGLLGANNVNTHEYQAYFAPSTATCGGTGAAMCDAGIQILPSVTNTTAFAAEILDVRIIKTGASTQDFVRALTGSINQAWAVGTATITDTAASKLVFGTRNTTASAASLAQLSYWVYVSPR